MRVEIHRLVACAAIVLAACGGPREDPLLRLSADEALAEGKALMEREKWRSAREHLDHAFSIAPNSAQGREALLLSADTLFFEGGNSFIKSEAKYRDFLNRFPTSNRADYVQFQIANSLFERMEKPDRDQTVTREAEDAFRDLIALYPTSEYVERAREAVVLVEGNLAEHEYLVGYFYLRFRLPAAAADRFEGLLESFPAYSEVDKILYHLGIAYRRTDQEEKAQEVFARLTSEYGDSEWASQVGKAK